MDELEHESVCLFVEHFVNIFVLFNLKKSFEVWRYDVHPKLKVSLVGSKVSNQVTLAVLFYLEVILLSCHSCKWNYLF